jgi:RNA polymerase sigma-70 factor (ECF subfamily)
MTDEHVARRLVRDDDEAFSVLYERYFRAAVSYASRYVRDPVSPEDIAQESFGDLWKHRHRYRQERGSIRAWLMILTRNRAIDATRRASSRLKVTVALEDAHGSAASDDVFAQTEHRDHRRRTLAAIAALPATQREVMSLHAYGDLSYSQIANRTGAPLGTVKSRSRLAMVAMRRDLAGELST